MPRRLLALDGLRGLLALYILAGHGLPFLWLPPGFGWIAGIATHGRAAVDLFFVLSGFVILHALDTETQAGGPRAALRFLALRAGRLLPVYWLGLALACLGLAAGDPFATMPWLPPGGAPPDGMAHAVLEAHWPPQAGWHVLAHLLPLQGLLPPRILPQADYTLLGPAWSLSTEWQFYALIALILAVAPRHLAQGGWRVIGGLLVFGLVSLILVRAGASAWLPGRAFLGREAWYFALGMASHATFRAGQSGWRFTAVLLIAMLMSGLAGEGKGLGSESVWGAMLVPLAWLFCLRAERPRNGADRALRRLLLQPPLLWCGGLSYSLYMVHAPLQRLAMLALAPWAAGDWPLFTALWILPGFLLPLAAAALVHRWIEAPARRWSRARLLRQSRRALSPFGSGSNTSAAGRP